MLNAGCAINILQHHDGPWLVREREKGGGTRKFKFFFFLFCTDRILLQDPYENIIIVAKVEEITYVRRYRFFNLDDA